MRLALLGGGLAAVSLAYFLQDAPDIASIDIIEKEGEPGGLCRGFRHEGRIVDIGPHIFFSKDRDTLAFMLGLLGENRSELRRSNRILHKGRLVRYPFENDLSSLPDEDRSRCLNDFLNNPYRDYLASNMLQFFLKIFGQGITDLYLRPYNEKIWKFDPAFMDTQMVERIPRPPDEDIKRGAAGETIEGYTHQLYFSYPKWGGTSVFVNSFIQRLNDKVAIHSSREATGVRETGCGWDIEAGGDVFKCDMLANCMPVDILTRIYGGVDADTSRRGRELRHNNIVIAAATVEQDRAGDNFAFMIADRDVIFHRLSKLDFLGENYGRPGTATYMMEYTYLDDDPVSAQSDDAMEGLFADGLKKIGFIDSHEEILSFTLKRFPYAYVVYDLKHKENMTAIRKFFKERNVFLNGRFGDFEYLNMDAVVAGSRMCAARIRDSLSGE